MKNIAIRILTLWPSILPKGCRGKKGLLPPPPKRNIKAEERYGKRIEITTWADGDGEKNEIICINEDICHQGHYARWNKSEKKNISSISIHIYTHISLLYIDREIDRSHRYREQIRLAVARCRGWRVEEMGKLFLFFVCLSKFNFLKKRNKNWLWDLENRSDKSEQHEKQ